MKIICFLLLFIPVSLTAQSWWEPDTIIVSLIDSSLQRHVYQRNDKSLPTTHLIQKQINNSWEDDCKTTYTYTDFDSILLKITQSYQNNQLSDSLKLENKYDERNLLIESLMKYFEDGQWMNGYLVTYTYDENKNIIKLLDKQWKDNQWKDMGQIIRSYDSNNNEKTFSLQYAFNGEDLVYFQRKTFDYDSTNNLIKEKIIIGQSEGLKMTEYVYYHYNEDNRLIFQTSQFIGKSKDTLSVLSSIEDSLINLQHIIYTYDKNGNLIVKLTQSWEHNQWKNKEENIYTYDENNNLLSSLTQFWRNHERQNKEQYSYVYDENNNTIAFYLQYWTKKQIAFDKIEHTIYYNNGKNYLSFIDAYKITISYKNYTK